MIAVIAEVYFYFLRGRSDHSNGIVIIWKPGFNLIMAYFKRKDCLQRNLCIIMKTL